MDSGICLDNFVMTCVGNLLENKMDQAFRLLIVISDVF